MRVFPAIIFAIIIVLTAPQTRADNVIVSIKPLHSLVAAVMQGTGTDPVLLIDGSTSPHDVSLKPSQMRALYHADVVFYMDITLETFLHHAFETLPAHVKHIPLAHSYGIRLLPIRKGDDWIAHDHGHHDDHDDDHDAHEKHHDDHDDDHDAHEEHHDDHDDDHDAHEEHHDDHDDDHDAHEEHHDDHDDDHDAHEEHHDDHDDDHDAHEEHHDDHKGLYDAHAWLDPRNAKSMVRAIAKTLTATYPEHKNRYRENAAATMNRLESLHRTLQKTFATVRGRSFMVFHDAYQYVETAYGLRAVGTVMTIPGQSPSLKHINAVRKNLRNKNVICIFEEPQFSNRIMETLLEGTTIRSESLDPLGTDIAPGPEMYFQMMTDLTQRMYTCLYGR